MCTKILSSPFHPCILLSVSPPLSCFLYWCGSAHSSRLFTQHKAERLQTICLFYAVSVLWSNLFFVALVVAPGLFCASGTRHLDYFQVPGFLCLPGMGAVVERMSLAPSPPVLNMPHDNTMLLRHMSSIATESQVILKHECTGLLQSGM